MKKKEEEHFAALERQKCKMEEEKQKAVKDAIENEQKIAEKNAKEKEEEYQKHLNQLQVGKI